MEKRILIRTLCVFLVITIILTLFALRMMQIQVVEGEKLANEIEKGWVSEQTIKAPRGEVLDRNGRPLVVNSVGRDVVIDMAYMEPGSTNKVIMRLIEIMEQSREKWIDNLPITDTLPFNFKSGDIYVDAIARLKRALGVEQYATVDDVVYNLREQYKLEELDDLTFRKVAGVRYEMAQRGFSMSAPYTFATDIKIETVPKIKERSFEIPGVDIVESPIRQYVSGDIAPHLIGRVGPLYKEEWDAAEKRADPVTGMTYALINGKEYSMQDYIGKDGVELAFEQYLKGTDGKRQIVQNAKGDVLEVTETQQTVPGNTVILTLDSRLQKVAQDALEKKILSMRDDLVNYPVGRGHEADAGAVAVVDCRNGEILALATYPSYNLSTFQQDYDTVLKNATPSRLVNRALMGSYTPGSIFKPTVALGGLTEGLVTKDEFIQCNRFYDVNGWVRTCLSAHGPVNLLNALRWSCNIFFYETGRRMGIDLLDKYAGMLGFGKPTGIELPEDIGRMSSPETKALIHKDNPEWMIGDTIQTSIGQFDTMATPLQLANYCATLANGGKRMRATVLKSVRSYAFDETQYTHEAEVVEDIDSPEAFAAIRDGMVAASRIGTSVSTFGEGVYEMTVASKTGTPETAVMPNSTFIAYAPAGAGQTPEIAVCVIIEKGWHGYTGAPVAREVFDAYFYSGETGDRVNQYNTLLP